MPGINTSGKSNTDDYLLGRGKLFFSLLDSTYKNPLAYRFLGNATEFAISLETDKLQHFSSTSGIRLTDAEVILSQQANLRFTLDEINFNNLALFMSGETGTFDIDSELTNGFTGAGLDNLYITEKGRWYPLYTSSPYVNSAAELFAMGVKITQIAGDTPANQGCIVDEQLGLIFVEEDSPLALNTALDVETSGWGVDANKPASPDMVKGFTKSSVTGALMFVSISPRANGHRVVYYIHQTTLSPEGDFNLISEEFATMAFTGVMEKNEVYSPNSPYITVLTHENANDNPPAFP